MFPGHPGSRGCGIRGEVAGDPVPGRSAPLQPPSTERHPGPHHLRRRDYLAYLRRICLCCNRLDFKAITPRVRWRSGRGSVMARITVEN